ASRALLPFTLRRRPHRYANGSRQPGNASTRSTCDAARAPAARLVRADRCARAASRTSAQPLRYGTVPAALLPQASVVLRLTIAAHRSLNF
ncbi:jg3641, partial [Pararge aegeria aegeria]